MPVSAKMRRRWFGALCLLAAILMLVVGETTPGERLDGAGFVVYWLACFLFATLAMLAAMLDVRALRREARAAQRELLESALEEIQREKTQISKPKPKAGSEPPGSGAAPRA